MLRLLLARHGETEENTAGILQGQGRGTLTRKGEQQIELLAQRLREEPIDRIFSSDQERARRTTEAIARYHTCPIEYSPLFRERGFGIYEGFKTADYLEAFQRHGGDRNQFRPEGGESVEDLFKRCRSILDLVGTCADDSTILVSTHSGVVRGLICLLEQRPSEDFWTTRISNTSVSLFVLNEGREIHSAQVNCISHLACLTS